MNPHPKCFATKNINKLCNAGDRLKGGSRFSLSDNGQSWCGEDECIARQNADGKLEESADYFCPGRIFLTLL